MASWVSCKAGEKRGEVDVGEQIRIQVNRRESVGRKPERRVRWPRGREDEDRKGETVAEDMFR